MQNEEKKYALKKPLRMPATGAAAQILNNNIGNNIFQQSITSLQTSLPI